METKKRKNFFESQPKRKNLRPNEEDLRSGVKFGNGVETNEQRIEMRNKQIQYGKNTVGYDNYLSLVPKDKRKLSGIHPRTPNPYEEVSKRAFDGQIKAWRRELHKWDDKELSIQTGINKKQIPNHISQKISSTKTVMELDLKIDPVVEQELQADNYCSDGENFDDEDIL